MISPRSFSEQICSECMFMPSLSIVLPRLPSPHFKAHHMLLHLSHNCNRAGNRPFMSFLRKVKDLFLYFCLICLKDLYRSVRVDAWKSKFVRIHRSIALACVDRRLIAQRLCSDRITKVTEAKEKSLISEFRACVIRILFFSSFLIGHWVKTEGFIFLKWGRHKFFFWKLLPIKFQCARGKAKSIDRCDFLVK